MSIYDLFSKRQKQLRGEVPDVYQYDTVPEKLRVQIVHIIRDSLGGDSRDYLGVHHYASTVYKTIHDALCREYGMFTLAKADTDEGRVFDFLLKAADYKQVLDVVELSFRLIDRYARNHSYQEGSKPTLKPDEAIDELNHRFKEHGVGYQYESGQVIQVDSEVLHAEVVKPALALLCSEARFKGANEEFLKAHAHYRHGSYKECLAEALKSFESVMKAMCDKQKWTYGPGDTAKKLIEICLNKGLIPSYLQAHFTSLKSVLESGIPTVRNKLGGHGQGTNTIQVPESIAAYALHLTASNIVFLAAAEKENCK